MPDAGTTTEIDTTLAIDDAGHDTTEAAASGPANDAAPEHGSNDDAQLDAALAAIRSGQGRAAATEAYQAAKPAAQAVTKVEDAPAPVQKDEDKASAGTTPAAQPFVPTDEQRQLLQRFQLDESILSALDATKAIKLLGNLKERHDAQALLWQENQRLKQQGQPLPQQQADPDQAKPATTTPEPVADAFARIDQIFAPFLEEGQGVAAPLKAAVMDAVGPALRQAQAAQAGMAAHWAHVAEQSKAEGLAEAKDSGINLDKRTAEGKANIEKLMETAERLLVAAQQDKDWTPYRYGYKQAISEALPSTFKAQTILAQRKAAAEQARKQARGGVDPGGLPNRTQKADTEDAALDRILEAQRQGATREELVRIGAGRS